MKIPIATIAMYGSKVLACDGRILRINVSRVNWRTEIVDREYVNRKDMSVKNLQEDIRVCSPQGVINMYYPELWDYLLLKAKI